MTLQQQLVASLEMEEEPMTTATAKPEVMPRDYAPSAMALLQMAVQQGAAIDTIERLAKLQREMADSEAQLAFNQAMQKAQSKMKRIGVDANNPSTRSNYATYAKLDSSIRPIYTEEGLSLSFDTADPPAPEVVRVLCYVSHSLGHTRTYKVDMPADGKGAKGGDVMTKTHAAGAAMSYGMRYLLKMIFNVAVGETDDDGNGAAGKGMAIEEFDRLSGLIENAGSIESLKQIYLAAAKDAKDAGDGGAMKRFAEIKDKRYKELARANR